MVLSMNASSLSSFCRTKYSACFLTIFPLCHAHSKAGKTLQNPYFSGLAAADKPDDARDASLRSCLMVGHIGSSSAMSASLFRRTSLSWNPRRGGLPDTSPAVLLYSCDASLDAGAPVSPESSGVLAQISRSSNTTASVLSPVLCGLVNALCAASSSHSGTAYWSIPPLRPASSRNARNLPKEQGRESRLVVFPCRVPGESSPLIWR